MSTTAAAIVSILLVAAGLYIAYRQTRRAIRHDAQRREQFIRSTVGPFVDTRPGTNLADLDACELLLDDPEFAARCERLWQAIRDEQQKGEQA
jgi:hypothetical protein